MALRGKKLSSDGAKAFAALHGFAPPPPQELEFRQPRGWLADLYDITRVEGIRRMDLGFGPHPKRFYHDYAPGHGPTMATDADGWGFLINGRYEITDHGIEDSDMAHYNMVRNARGQYVPVAHYSQNPYAMHRNSYGYGAQSNPWNPALSAMLLIGGGLLGGVLVNAAIQAMPARIGDTAKDGISLVIAGIAAYVPSSMGARLAGIAAAVTLVGGVVNRRTDATNRLVGWVNTRFASMYDRMMPAGGAAAATPTPGSTPAMQIPANNPAPGANGTMGYGVDSFGLPIIQFAGN